MSASQWILDVPLMMAGGGVLLLGLLGWRRRGWRDPLRGAPLRPNRLSPLLVWLCFLAHLGGWAVGSTVASAVVPGEPDGHTNYLASWRSLLAANIAQILVAGTCLAVAWPAFRNHWRGLGLGRRPLRLDLPGTIAGLLAAICVCQSLVLATTWAINRLWPRFEYPDHSVFRVLEAPQTTSMMRLITIAGALILAPIGEELFFRGIVQTGVKKLVPRKWGTLRHRWIAIGVTAFLFASLHLAIPHHVVAMAALAVILGYLYERTGSLLMPILIHTLFNGKSLLWYGLKHWFSV